MQQFGNWCVVVYDFKIFETKIRAIMEGLYYLHGAVEYYSSSINGENLKLKNGLVLSIDGSRVLFDESKKILLFIGMCSVKFQVIKNNLNGACWLYKENGILMLLYCTLKILLIAANF